MIFDSLKEYLGRYKKVDSTNVTFVVRYVVLTEREIESLECMFTKNIWKIISGAQTLSESFIDKYIDKLNLVNIATYQNLSEEFIERHFDKFDFNKIVEYQTLSYDFLIRNIYRYNLYKAEHGINSARIYDIIKKYNQKYDIDKLNNTLLS